MEVRYRGVPLPAWEFPSVAPEVRPMVLDGPALIRSDANPSNVDPDESTS